MQGTTRLGLFAHSRRGWICERGGEGPQPNYVKLVFTGVDIVILYPYLGIARGGGSHSGRGYGRYLRL